MLVSKSFQVVPEDFMNVSQYLNLLLRKEDFASKGLFKRVILVGIQIIFQGVTKNKNFSLNKEFTRY